MLKEVFLEVNVKSVSLSFGIIRQYNDTGNLNCKGMRPSQQSLPLATLSLYNVSC